jgi:hypothetical protein
VVIFYLRSTDDDRAIILPLSTKKLLIGGNKNCGSNMGKGGELSP